MCALCQNSIFLWAKRLNASESLHHWMLRGQRSSGRNTIRLDDRQRVFQDLVCPSEDGMNPVLFSWTPDRKANLRLWKVSARDPCVNICSHNEKGCCSHHIGSNIAYAGDWSLPFQQIGSHFNGLLIKKNNTYTHDCMKTTSSPALRSISRLNGQNYIEMPILSRILLLNELNRVK